MVIEKSDLHALTLGVRFEKSFRVADMIGHIFDDVLHGKSSPFNTDIFPNYHELSSQDKALVHNERGDFLRVTVSDVIFRYYLKEADSSTAEIEWFRNDACQYVLDRIFGRIKVANIYRAGIMYTHNIEASDLGGMVLTKLKHEGVNNVDQFSLTFGKKDTTAEGYVKKGVDDYINRINTIKQIAIDKYEFTLDYQYYFKPHLDKIDSWNFDNFFQKSQTYLNDHYYTLVNGIVFNGKGE